MITEELENKLKISRNTCIYCPTLELAKQVLNIFDQLKLKWCSGICYTKCTNWEHHKENTVYYPFKGAFSSLEFAQSIGYKIINAEKFISLHIENYEPKGELEGFPKEIITHMLKCQEEQGHLKNVSVFEKDRTAGEIPKGFIWSFTKEGYDFWNKVIRYKNFDLFFEKYPNQEEVKVCSKCHKEKSILENYEPKGQLIGFPKEIISHMLDYQEEQGNPRDISVFEKNRTCCEGFLWHKTKEGFQFWEEVIREKNFNLFFEKYPKKDEVKTCSKCHKEKPLSEFHKKENTVCSEYEECRKQEYQVFITLHIEDEEFDLKNYKPKGEITGFPKEIIARMLDYQEEQGNPRDISVFEKQFDADQDDKGFTWNETKEKFDFWEQVIHVKNFNHFFEKYPKKEEYQEFRVGDKVIDILFDLKGKITNVKSNGNLEIQFEGESCPIEFMKIAKREPNRWRANRGGGYWVIENFSVYKFKENNTDIDDTYNNLGNYFQTEKEAQEVADKLKKYFQELIKSK